MLVVDLDGPILDGRHRHHECYSRILESFGAKPLGLSEYWQLKRASGDRRALLAMSGVQDRYSDFMSQWLATIESPEMLALDRVQSGAVEALRALRANGPLALVTSRMHEGELLRQLEAKGLRAAFDHVVCATRAETGEAKAAAFTARLSGTVARGWIGDTEVDIRAGRVLGVPSFAVACGLRTREYLLGLAPDFIYENLEELVKQHEAYPIGPRPAAPR